MVYFVTAGKVKKDTQWINRPTPPPTSKKIATSHDYSGIGREHCTPTTKLHKYIFLTTSMNSHFVSTRLSKLTSLVNGLVTAIT